MTSTHSLRRITVAALLAIALLSQGTPVLAAATGGISGYVIDDTSAPVVGATVTAKSASATESVPTDTKGHFVFLSLPPDTYTVSTTAPGYIPASVAGITVFADQMETTALRSPRALKTIATVRANAGGVVKPGTTADIYSVNAAAQQIVGTVAGGYNLNSAYSGIYSQPGVTSDIGNYGQGQDFYIRGASYSQTGYEFDGVPVNRAFDNYNGNTLSNVGQQELEVYTGGSPSSGTSATLGGYINQVIKTGTYPGFINADLGIGNPTFYNHLQLEAGGSSPDRLFSYYLGFGAFNQNFRTLNNADGGNLSTDGNNPEGFFGTESNVFAAFNTGFYGNGPFSVCPNQDGTQAPSNSFQAPAGDLGGGGGVPLCNAFGAPTAGTQTSYSDREIVANFHFAIPHKRDSWRDDIQLLIDTGYTRETWADSVNDLGGLSTFNNLFAFAGGAASGYCAVTGIAALFGFSSGNCASGGPSPFPYQDGRIFAAGTSFGQNASTATVIPYYFPGSSTQRPLYSGLDLNARSTVWNDMSIVKLQYQKNFGSTAYARIYGYSFYSDWLQNSPEQATLYYGLAGFGFAASGDYPSPDYVLDTHTTGVSFEYANQINAKNLVRFTANYVQARLNRFNNQTWLASGLNTKATNLADADGNCYSYTSGAIASCFSGSTSGTYGTPTRGLAETACAFLPATPACTAGASWIVTRPSGTGTTNSIRPKFMAVALEDDWRPNDKLDVTAGVRMENYTYNLANSSDPMDAFWFAQADKVFCYDPVTLLPLLNVLSPTSPPPASPVTTAPGAACPTAPSGQPGRHPDGVGGDILFTNVSPSALSQTLFSPRIGGTYTLNADTVLRFSAGRYTQPTPAAFEQYLNQYGAAAASGDFSHFFGFGFYNPSHNNPAQTSNNFDVSLEKRLKGTDVTFKVSPFYRDTTHQAIDVPLGPNFDSAVNLGTQHTFGVELQIQKGDPTRDGWSGAVSYTYTDAKIRFENAPSGTNAIDTLNGYINAFNALTSAGGGSPCYNPAVQNSFGNIPDPTCSAVGTIRNPYYGMSLQPLLNRTAFYPTYINAPPVDAFPASSGEGDFTAISPNFFTGWIQWKHKKLAIAPTFALAEGVAYGSPGNIYGLDPRTCAQNQGTTGADTNPAYAGYADYFTCGATITTNSGYLAVPDPYTGTFDQLGQYRNPWQLNIGAQVRYDISPKITAVLNVANIYNTCFGGSSTPWSRAYPAGHYVCSYDNQYITAWPGVIPGEGFFYGASPNDPVNGTAGFPGPMRFPYQPQYPPNGLGSALPIQAYLEFLIKL